MSDLVSIQKRIAKSIGRRENYTAHDEGRSITPVKRVHNLKKISKTNKIANHYQIVKDNSESPNISKDCENQYFNKRKLRTIKGAVKSTSQLQFVPSTISQSSIKIDQVVRSKQKQKKGVPADQAGQKNSLNLKANLLFDKSSENAKILNKNNSLSIKGANQKLILREGISYTDLSYSPLVKEMKSMKSGGVYANSFIGANYAQQNKNFSICSSNRYLNDSELNERMLPMRVTIV